MELKDFLKTALVDLVNGVEEAKSELKEKGEFICPPIGSAYRKEFNFHFDAMGIYFQKVEFDVAVTVGDEANFKGGAEGKMGIKVFGASVSADADCTLNNSTVSRLKFHVPIALPFAKNKDNFED